MLFCLNNNPCTRCLPLKHRTLKTSQRKHNVWLLSVTSPINWYQPLGFILDLTSPPKKFPICDSTLSNHVWDDVRSNTGCPKWTRCNFPKTGVVFPPYDNTLVKRHNWSYTSLEPIVNQWTTFGWVSPTHVALPSHSLNLRLSYISC